MALKRDGLGGLAKKWLQAKKTELLTADHRRADAASADASDLGREIEREATGQAIISAVPGLRGALDRSDANRAQREADRDAGELAALRARPMATLDLTVTGEASGSWAGQLPARVEVDDAFDGLKVDLTPLPESVPLIGGVPLEGWAFIIPGFHGVGSYDLAAIYKGLEAGGGYAPDTVDYGFGLGGWDEAWYWHSDAGTSSVVASGEGGRHLELHLAMDGAGGSIEVVAAVDLPEPVAS